MIYRVLGEATVWVWSEQSGALEVAPGNGPLVGAWTAGLAPDAWDGLVMPRLTNPRVRFWFTQDGWRRYGRAIAAGARASGVPHRVVRRKNPPRSSIVYRDRWQVALLPRRGTGVTAG